MKKRIAIILIALLLFGNIVGAVGSLENSSTNDRTKNNREDHTHNIEDNLESKIAHSDYDSSKTRLNPRLEDEMHTKPSNYSIQYVLVNDSEEIKVRKNINLSDLFECFTLNLTEGSNCETNSDSFELVWMDFNPQNGENGGYFEGDETWKVTKHVYMDDFDNTDDFVPEWTKKPGLYSKVRTDEDLWDPTSAKGAWCTAGGENSGVPWADEDSRGWAKCEKFFDLNDYVDMSRPGFCFMGDPANGLDTTLICDYKIDGVDFDHVNDHVYFNIYLDDGSKEWPFLYHFRSCASDIHNDGYCIAFWDPGFQDYYPKAWDHVNPEKEEDEYCNDKVVVRVEGSTVYYQDLWTFLNRHGSSYTLRFELYIRLYGTYFNNEIIKYWVDDTQLKLWYWYDHPPFSPNNPNPSDGTHYVDVNTKLRWYGGDPDWYISPIDTVSYDIYFGTSSNPPYVGTIGSYPADNNGPFYFDPGKLSYDKHYYWKVVAVDSYGLKTSSDIWDFYTENSAPKTPDRPSGPSSGWHGTSYSYSTKTSDPDGHSVYYLFDWDDGSTSGWKGPYPSGDQISCSNTWSTPGTYDVKVKAKDSLNAESSWSTILTVSMGNKAPVRPNPPIGPTTGWHGTAYTFSAETTDPENDRIYYNFDWGDGTTSGWIGPAPSGQRVSTDHTWNEPKQYAIRVKAKDVFNKETIWSGYAHISLANRAPKEPSNPKPTDDDSWVDIDADLSWSCSDPDGDPLTYTIYFGTENPPPMVKDNYESCSYALKRMREKTTYYWKIIATDKFGALTSGPLWQFTTRSYTPPVLSNYDSWLEGVDIEWGNYSAEFTFRVHYYDADGDPPEKKELIIDDNIFEMTGSGSDADYALTLKGKDVGGGEHYYYFSFTDGTLSEGARLPKEYSWNFTVNYPPNKPEIAGDREVKKGETCTFEAMAEDTDEDRLWYYFDFGDGENSGWTPVLGADSGEIIQCNHTFNEIGTYDVRVRARDEYGDIGPWSDPIEIKVPVNTINRQTRIVSFFDYLYEKLNIQKLLCFMT